MSPVLSRVPDTDRYSMSFCQINEWVNEWQRLGYILVEKYISQVTTFLLSIGLNVVLELLLVVRVLLETFLLESFAFKPGFPGGEVAPTTLLLFAFLDS